RGTQPRSMSRSWIGHHKEVPVALRGFVGDDGQDWQVWDTRPTIPTPNAHESDHDKMSEIRRFSEKREGGWLTFTTARERRRLSPIPDAWESVDETALRGMLADADEVHTPD